MIKCLCLTALRLHIRSVVHFVVTLACFCSFVFDSQWGAADAEIKVSSAESSEKLKALPLKPGEGQNIDISISPTASTNGPGPQK